MSEYSRDPLRWGVLGTGNIARQFSNQLSDSKWGILAGAASRSADRAQHFLSSLENGQSESALSFPDYEGLVNASEIDAVYVALPNTLHSQWTSAALRAGKHVLCEKPLALDAAGAKELFVVAEENRVTLIEGFMYRAHPQTKQLLETVYQGAVGDLRLIEINFCFNRPASKEDARYHPNAGGGSLMDVGCYCIDLARALTREEPEQVVGLGHPHEYGVDDCFSGSLFFPGGTLVSFVCGMTLTTDQTTRIYGTDGWIEIPRFWKAEEGFTLHHPDGTGEAVHLSDRASLPPIYALEADAFYEAVNGEPSWNPRENTIANLETIDRLRSQKTESRPE